MDYSSRELVMDKIQEVSHWGGSEDSYDGEYDIWNWDCWNPYE